MTSLPCLFIVIKEAFVVDEGIPIVANVFLTHFVMRIGRQDPIEAVALHAQEPDCFILALESVLPIGESISTNVIESVFASPMNGGFLTEPIRMGPCSPCRTVVGIVERLPVLEKGTLCGGSER